MRTIYVDADACPVKDEVYKVARRYGWRVLVVANQPINTPRSPLIVAITVGAGADVADDFIAERVGPGDIVITSDVPLADRALKKDARVVGARGREFTRDSIGDALASRDLAEHLREIGIQSGGPPPLGKKDRSAFLGKLDQLVNAVIRKHGRGDEAD